MMHPCHSPTKIAAIEKKKIMLDKHGKFEMLKVQGANKFQTVQVFEMKKFSDNTRLTVYLHII